MIDHEILKSEIQILDYAFQILYNKHVLSSFNLLDEYPHVTPKEGGFKLDKLLSIPSVILLAFSLELAIKEIIFNSTGIQSRNLHNLSILFADIEENKKNIIINKVIEQYKAIDNSNEFNKKLLENSNSFIERRYIFESNGETKNIDIKFLHTLLKCIKNELGINNIAIKTKLPGGKDIELI